jgi:Mce-associated membrane protein
MAEAKEPPQDSVTSKADTAALIEEAEAEAAEAEALAAAARARARAARLRREALAQAEAEAEAEAQTDETAEAAEEGDAAEDASDTDTGEAETDKDSADTEEAETEEVSDETTEDAESETEPVRRRRLRLPSLSVTWKAAAILLICAFVAASGYMVWQRHETTERDRRVANFIAGARQGVVNMTSLDFNKAKEDVQRLIDSSTGQFRDDFQQRAKDFTTVVEQSKVVTQGTVNAAAVQTINGDYALVLVAATSHITNAAGAKDEPRTWRLKVTVKDDGGQYKMSNVEFIP